MNLMLLTQHHSLFNILCWYKYLYSFIILLMINKELSRFSNIIPLQLRLTLSQSPSYHTLNSMRGNILRNILHHLKKLVLITQLHSFSSISTAVEQLCGRLPSHFLLKVNCTLSLHRLTASQWHFQNLLVEALLLCQTNTLSQFIGPRIELNSLSKVIILLQCLS